MPRPVYIICSESGAIDAKTNVVSLFNVIEIVKIYRLPEGQSPKPVPFRVMAVWMREPSDDPDQKFDAQIVLTLPPHSEEIVISESTISFAKSLHRLLALGHLQGLPGLGVMLVTCRLRRSGEQDWLAKLDYPILIEELVVPAAPSNGEHAEEPSG